MVKTESSIIELRMALTSPQSVQLNTNVSIISWFWSLNQLCNNTLEKWVNIGRGWIAWICQVSCSCLACIMVPTQCFECYHHTSKTWASLEYHSQVATCTENCRSISETLWLKSNSYLSHVFVQSFIIYMIITEI